MRKVSVQEFRDAMVVVNIYCTQIEPRADLQPHEPGCRVRLSEHGRLMQGNYKHEGTVVDYFPWMGKITDGLVTVKWDDRKKPQDMHISQVEAIKKKQ